MMCRGDNRQQLHAIINSEFILKQLAEAQHIDAGMHLLQRAGLTAASLDSWPQLKPQDPVKPSGKKNKKRRKKKKPAEGSSADPIPNYGFETICRRLSSKQETLEALGPDIDGVLVGTPNAERFVDVLNSYMGSYLKDTTLTVEKQLKDVAKGNSRTDKQLLMERLQEELEAVFDTCMHIETIVGQYFAHHKRPMEKLRQRSEWLGRDLYKLVMTRVLPLPKMKELLQLSSRLLNSERQNDLQQLFEMCDYSAPAAKKQDDKTEEQQRQRQRLLQIEEENRLVQMLSCARLPVERIPCEFSREWLWGLELSLIEPQPPSTNK